MKQIIPEFIKQPVRVLREIPKDIKAAYLNQASSIHPKPIIILGHQKTGTTAIAALLGKATGKTFIIDPLLRVKRQDEVRDKLYNNELFLQDFIRRNKLFFSFDIIKDPNFSFLYEEVRECFPNAKYIFINRDPRDNLRSILNRLKIPGNLPKLNNSDLDKLPQNWRIAIEGKHPSVSGSNYIEKLAHRWNIAAENYIKNRDSMVYISYEDFMKDKNAAIYNLAKKIGLKPEHDISKQVDVQYQPRGDHNTTWLDFFGKNNLHQINDICADKIKLFNYDL